MKRELDPLSFLFFLFMSLVYNYWANRFFFGFVFVKSLGWAIASCAGLIGGEGGLKFWNGWPNNKN